MKAVTETKERVRIHISMPIDSHVELVSISGEFDMKTTQAIREAIANWVEGKKSELRREGYLARREENLAMMEEFKEIDREVW